MANIKVPNLCGANAEFNSVQSKFESLLSDAIAGLESEASSLASTLDSAVTSLTTDLRDLMPEVPSLPDANLQSLLTSLSGLIPGTPEYITLLDEITTKFGTELAAAGHTLETLITNARTQIEGGGDLCSVVPNFTKASDGLADAVEKSAESLQPTVDALEEKTSTLVKNAEVVLQNSGLITRTEKLMVEVSTAADVVAGTITSTELPETGEVFISTDEIKKFAYGLENIITEVTTPADQGDANITTATGGFSHKRTRGQERFKESDVTQSGDTWIIKLAHPTVGVATLTGNCLITTSSAAYHSAPTTFQKVQAFVHIAKKGEHIEFTIANHTATSAYYEVETDGQTIKITGSGNVFFPHSSEYETYFDEKRKDVEFTVGYDYNAISDADKFADV